LIAETGCWDTFRREISPPRWRRLLVRSESSLAQLHDIIQIAFGWSDSHLHRFRIHGRDYGISQPGGPGFAQDAHQVRLADFQFRRNGRFLDDLRADFERWYPGLKTGSESTRETAA
jgi:hypothetical protein